MTEDQFSAYRTAKSTRPSWANALIITGLLLTSGVVAFIASMDLAWWLFAAAGVTAVVAGIYALVGATRRAP